MNLPIQALAAIGVVRSVASGAGQMIGSLSFSDVLEASADVPPAASGSPVNAAASASPLDRLITAIRQRLVDAGIVPQPPVSFDFEATGNLSVDPADPRADRVTAAIAGSPEIDAAAARLAGVGHRGRLTVGSTDKLA